MVICTPIIFIYADSSTFSIYVGMAIKHSQVTGRIYNTCPNAPYRILSVRYQNLDGRPTACDYMRVSNYSVLRGWIANKRDNGTNRANTCGFE